MSTAKLSETWIFEQHPKEEIQRWINQLHYFEFKRAWGGHANDGDEFKVAFSFEDEKDLLYKLNQIGITVNTIPDNYPRAIIGKSYSYEEFKVFKSEILGFPNLEQPGGSQKVFGEQVFIWVNGNHYFEVTVSGSKDGNYFDVTEEDFDKCLRLEKEFDLLGWKKGSGNKESVCVLSKEKYPELYFDKE